MDYSKEEMRDRVAKSKAMICPDCGNRLEFVPAKEMHPTAYNDSDRARKCVNPSCEYICCMGD